MKFVREKATVEEELIWQPSGLRVRLEAILSPTTVRVRAPRTGTTFVLSMDRLEHVTQPADVDEADMFTMDSSEAGDPPKHSKDILAFVLRQAGLDAMADKAATGYYHDYMSPLAAPCIQLAKDLKEAGTPAALAWWAAMGKPMPSRGMVAAKVGWKVTAGHLKNVAGSLRSRGMIEYPGPGVMTLSSAGRAAAPAPDTEGTLIDSLKAVLDGAQKQVLDVLLPYQKTPGAGWTVPRELICEKLGWSPTAGHVKNVLGSLRTMEIITYPSAGKVTLAPWVK